PAVLGWGGAQRAQEGAPHRLARTEATGPGDGFDRVVRLLEPAPRHLDADALDVAGWCHADLLAEHAREVPLAEPDAVGECGNGEVVARVRGDPRLQIAQRVAVGGLGREVRREL